MDIETAYEIYKRMTCRYHDLDRIPDIFTEDFVGGNAGFGQLRGLEAQEIFLTTSMKMGLEPEEHLWCRTDGHNLAFRARNWAGKRHESAFFDVIGNLTFDPKRAKFCFYYGFYDPRSVAEVLGTSTTVSFSVAEKAFRDAREATSRFESAEGFDPSLPDHMRVSSSPTIDI